MRQVRSSQAQAGTIKRRQEEDGSKEPSRAAASDQGSAATDEAPTQPRVLVLQRDLLPNLPLVASIARVGLDVAGPFNRVSQARTWIETNRPAAAVLDIVLWDGSRLEGLDGDAAEGTAAKLKWPEDEDKLRMFFQTGG